METQIVETLVGSVEVSFTELFDNLGVTQIIKLVRARKAMAKAVFEHTRIIPHENLLGSAQIAKDVWIRKSVDTVTLGIGDLDEVLPDPKAESKLLPLINIKRPQGNKLFHNIKTPTQMVVYLWRDVWAQQLPEKK